MSADIPEPPSDLEFRAYHVERMEQAVDLFEMTLATYEGVNAPVLQAEVHDSGAGPILAVVPHISRGRQMFGGASYLNHSVFEEIGLANEEHPEIFRLVYEVFGLRQESRLSRATLYDDDDGRRILALRDRHGVVDDRLMRNMSQHFGVDDVVTNFGDREVVIEAATFGNNRVTEGRAHIRQIPGFPKVTDYEVGVATDIIFLKDNPTIGQLSRGIAGTNTFDAEIVVSGHRTHGLLQDAIDEHYGTDRMRPFVHFGDLDHDVAMRHTCDHTNNRVQIDLIVTPVESQGIGSLDEVVDLSRTAGSLLLGYARGLSDAEFRAGEFFRFGQEPGEDEYVPVYAGKELFATVGVYLPATRRIGQQILELGSFLEVVNDDSNRFVGHLAGNDWRVFANPEAAN